jgi:hypothetical protein
MKKLSILFLVCVAFAGTAFAGTFKITNVYDKPTEIKAYEKDSGQYLWKCTDTFTTFEADGQTFIRFTEDGEGQYGNDKKFRTWKADSTYLYENGTMVPQSTRIEFQDKDGVVVGTLRTTFDAKNGKVICKLLNDKKEFDFKEGLIDKDGLGVAFMNYSSDIQNEFAFPMLTNEPSFYYMTLVDKGKEIIIVDGKEVECCKFQMVPDLGFLGIFAPFVPKTFFWYRAEFPHEFVRYEGLESGLNTPYIVMKVGEQK